MRCSSASVRATADSYRRTGSAAPAKPRSAAADQYQRPRGRRAGRGQDDPPAAAGSALTPLGPRRAYVGHGGRWDTWGDVGQVQTRRRARGEPHRDVGQYRLDLVVDGEPGVAATALIVHADQAQNGHIGG